MYVGSCRYQKRQSICSISQSICSISQDTVDYWIHCFTWQVEVCKTHALEGGGVGWDYVQRRRTIESISKSSCSKSHHFVYMFLPNSCLYNFLWLTWNWLPSSTHDYMWHNCGSVLAYYCFFCWKLRVQFQLQLMGQSTDNYLYFVAGY